MIQKESSFLGGIFDVCSHEVRVKSVEPLCPSCTGVGWVTSWFENRHWLNIVRSHFVKLGTSCPKICLCDGLLSFHCAPHRHCSVVEHYLLGNHVSLIYNAGSDVN